MPDTEYVCGCVVFMARTCDSLKGTEIHITYHAIRINMFLNNQPVLQCLNFHLWVNVKKYCQAARLFLFHSLQI